MSVMQTRQSLQKACADLQYCKQRLPYCYTIRQRQSLMIRIQKLQCRITHLNNKLYNETIAEQRRIAYKQQMAGQRAFNATYYTMKPRRGSGRRYY